MKTVNIGNAWQLIRRRVSEILIVCMIITGIAPANVTYAKSYDYQFADELEIDDTLIDDGMFYIPHGSFDVNEGDINSKGKYVFKIKRKGDGENAEKVKLTMIDMAGKYGKDYSIKVIDKAFFSENVQNGHISKSIEEFMRTTEYEEYNFSDAVVDGAITSDMVMSDEEKENFTFSEEDKKELIDNAKKIMDENGFGDDIKEADLDSIEEEIDNRVNGFTNTETESESETTEETSEETTEETSEETEEETTEETTAETTTETTEETTVETSEETSEEKKEETTKETEAETTTAIGERIESSDEETTLEPTTTTTRVVETENVAETEKTIIEADIVDSSSTPSEIIYGDEEVQFEVKKGTMSTTDAYELITGLPSDRKKVAVDRSGNPFGINANSLDDAAFMKEGIEVVQEELKSAYVILEFKAGQNEKLIEISITNDKEYTGERQIGFNLSSVDGSEIAGMYSAMTLFIHDDEDQVPSYIGFVKNKYEPKNGYVTVEVERTGASLGIATCMIDAEDITAVAGRDYSKVHAKLIFGLGVNKRTVKIPVVSKYVDDALSFKLKLQLPEGALIGDNDTAICTIKKDDLSFEFAEKVLDTNDKLLTSGNDGNLTAPSPANGISIHDLQDGKDYDLDSIIVGDPISMDKCCYYFARENGNDNSYERYINNNQGLEVYLEDHSISGDTAITSWYIFPNESYETSGFRMDSYNGVQINWSVDSSNHRIVIHEFMDDESQSTLADDSDGTWSGTYNYFLSNTAWRKFYCELYRYDGFWRTSPTLKIQTFKPILRMYKINLAASDVPELIGDDGQMTRNHKYAKYAQTSIEGCKSDHTAVGWSGKTITVKLDNAKDNPFYIKSINLQRSDGSGSRLIVSNDDTSATSLSFKMDEDFATNNRDIIDLIARPGSGGGRIGEFYIKAELGTKEGVVRIMNDDRVDVNIWNDQYPPTVTTESKDYTFRIGDVLHFFANVKPEQQDEFKCDGLDVYNIVPYSPDWYTIRRPTDESNYFPLDVSISEIKIIPELSPNENKVVVRLDKNSLSKFDQTYGFLATARRRESGDYYEYDIETDATKITARYFDIKARCNDDNSDMTPVWYENNKTGVKYAQDEYYLLGSEHIADNILYLTCEKAESINYSLVGGAYYEEVPIGEKTASKYWQAAVNIGVLIDETHFGYSDMVGTFSTIPGKGKNGYYKKFKVVSDGADKYMTAALNNDNKVTRTYTIEYDEGTKTITEDVYEVYPETVLISNVQKNHPHVDRVQILNMAGTSLGAVYINDDITILKSFVTTKKSDGTYYTYSYVDEQGVTHTEDEHVKRIEYVVIDKNTHNIKYVIEATESNADKTEWTARYTFERGNYGLYMSDDKLYVRIVTDRKVGDGKGADIDPSSGGDRKDIPIFNETTYQAIASSYAFIEESEKEPYVVDFPFPADHEHPISLPIIGDLSTMINALGMSFGIEADGDSRIRLFIGKKFNGGGNRYDEKGDIKSDAGYAVGLSNFTTGMGDMVDKIKQSGTKRLGVMTLGVPTWDFEPIIGVYFEFMLYHDPKASVKDEYCFVGGGGYFGGVLDLRYTFYFLVVAVPCYVGGEVNLSLVAEFGVSVDDGVHIAINDPSQDFFNDLFTKTHFEFLVRAILVGSAYVGVGVAGTAGVRGGFQLTLNFIYNPFVRKNYPQVEHTIGFSATGQIKIWMDVILCSIPIPVYTWFNKRFAYFEDVKNLFPDGDTDSVTVGRTDNTIKPKPRFGNGSTFTANGPLSAGYFGGTYVEDTTRALVTDVYDASEPKLIKYDDNKALLVYLDDDTTRSDYDRTALRYMLYDNLTGTWSNPQDIHPGSVTADFGPSVCDCGDKILVSWSSRLVAVTNDTNKKDLLTNMEIWAVFFDKASESFETIERITNDQAYDYYPKATYDPTTDIVYLYYLKNDNVGNIETAEDLLDETQTDVNGSYLMYMLYADSDGTGKKWLRDYYDNEIPSGLSPAEQNEWKAKWNGQRFKNLAIDIGGTTPVNNDPNISDYDTLCTNIFDASEIMDEINYLRSTFALLTSPISSNPAAHSLIDDFNDDNLDKYKPYNLLAYVVEADGDPTTKEDTDIYLKIQHATYSDIQTIRLTYNNVPDTCPKFVKNGDDLYLFWVQNEGMIKMLSLNQLILKAIDEEHANNGLKEGNINIVTIDKLILSDKITNIYPFVDENRNLYVAWQQNSAENTVEASNSSEIEFKQDLYVAGLVKTVDPITHEVTQCWTNPVRFTNNGKINDLPTAVSFGDKLMLVDNQYNLKSEGDTYSITNSNLQEINYKPSSSIEIASVATNLDTKNSDSSVRYKLQISAQNTGLFTAEGFDYTGHVTYDGNTITSFSGGSTDRVFPGNITIIGGATPGGAAPIVTPDIYFTLTKEQLHHLDKVKVDLNVIERNVLDTGCSSTKNAFAVAEQFSFVVQSEVDNSNSFNKNLRVVQTDKGFEIKGILTNTGNVDSHGNERIYVIDQNNWDKPIAKSGYINLEYGKQKQFTIPISQNIVGDTKYGIKDLVLFVKNDEGKLLSEYEIATVNASIPYNFKVNGSSKQIDVQVGQKLKLNTTYEPSNRYRSATILYSVEDQSIARTVGDSIIGSSVGKTVLNLTTKEFGGTKDIVVNVVPYVKPDPVENGDGSSDKNDSGSATSGPIVDRPNVSRLSAVKASTIKANSSDVTWVYDPVNNIWKLKIGASDSNYVDVKNAFIEIESEKVTIINGVTNVTKVSDTYCFDTDGKMLTGWVQTGDGKWYFFENVKNLNEGKMVKGWRIISGAWYYFTEEGAMLTNAITPDGYKVNAEGKWIQ